jgi:hypothetical protein
MMFAGTGATVTAALPVLPSLVALMLTLPTPTAVTNPDTLTFAFVESEVVHVTVRPVSGAFLTSSVVADICCAVPTIIEGVAGETVTLATGTCTTVKDA